MGRTRLERAMALIRKEIVKYQRYKKRILDHVDNIKNKRLSNEITHYEYEKLIHQKIDGKTVQEWLDYYDSRINKFKKKIRDSLRKLKINKFLLITSSFLLISFLLLSAFFIGPIITGFVAKEKMQTFTQELNLEFLESTNYELQLETLGQLDSLKISGLIEGDGGGNGKGDWNVKVYLDDLLIMDSSKVKSKKVSKITGLLVEEQDRSVLELYLGFLKVNFSRITGRVAETDETLQDSDSSSEDKEEAPEDSSPSLEPSSSEQSEEPAISSDDLGDTEEVGEVENIEKNGELDVEGQKLEESNSEIQEEVPEDSSPSQEPPLSDKSEEAKEKEKEEEKKEEKKENEITIKEFKNVCEQTCKNLGLNKSSYTLKIEISNAKLKLNEIKYKLVPIKIELPEKNKDEGEDIEKGKESAAFNKAAAEFLLENYHLDGLDNIRWLRVYEKDDHLDPLDRRLNSGAGFGPAFHAGGFVCDPTPINAKPSITVEYLIQDKKLVFCIEKRYFEDE